MRIVCLSDTHLIHEKRSFEVPEGDVLIHAGDFTMRGTEPEIRCFHRWFTSLPHPHKVVVAGNHDWLFERDPARARALMTGCIYLEDSAATVQGLCIWGSPWTPWFFDWAFNLHRGDPIRRKWQLIPGGIDILITHGPPLGILDLTVNDEPAGCGDLLKALERIRPRLHIFGHIHEGYGQIARDGTIYVNASICDERYRGANAPVVVEL